MSDPAPRPRLPLPAVTAALLLGLLAAGGCRGEAPSPPPEAPASATPDPFAGTPAGELPVVARAAAYAPAAAEVVTVTDWDRLRDRLGVPSLTSASDAGDRFDFWARVRGSAVVLTPSRLHEADARLLAEFGFTADDVDWQAGLAGPDGDGFVLALRPDLPLDGVRRAVQAGVAGLGGAELLAEERVVLGGTAVRPDDGAATWRTDPALVPVVADAARESGPEAVYLRRGCVPLAEALGGAGGGAGGAEAERVLAAHELDELAPVEGFSVTFGALVATARMGAERLDIFERGEVVGDWPPTTDPSFADAFGTDPVVDPSTGRLGLILDDPAAAARVTLDGVLPHAVCPTAP